MIKIPPKKGLRKQEPETLDHPASPAVVLETSINRMLKHSVPLAQVFVESLEVTVITWIKVGNPLCGLDA
jgi:hypothetical protein